MRTFLATLACLLPLTMAACGGPTTPDNEGGGAGSGTSFSALIEVVQPDGILGTFTLRGDEIEDCINVSSCEIPVEEAGTYEVGFIASRRLFVPEQASVVDNGQRVQLTMDKWVLPPIEGSYRDEVDDVEILISIEMVESAVTLNGVCNGFPVTLIENHYRRDFDTGASCEGTVAESQDRVDEHIVSRLGAPDDRIYRLVR